MNNRFVVIMAGGNGERFWPESRKTLPKQFLPIVGDQPMLTQTINRLKGMIDPHNIFVIAGERHRSVIIDICPDLDPEKVIGEPIGRDTAPAVALATTLVSRENPKAVFAILPADAVIYDADNFCLVLESAFVLAEAEPVLVTIGIKPTSPATGYGYIKKSEAKGEYAGLQSFHVSRFVEKPNLERAKEYLASGDFYWNAGMFIWSVDSIRAEFEKNCSGLWKSLLSVNQALDGGEPLVDILARQYPTIEKISVDYAVIEKANNVAMIESTFDWDDVGEWSAIERHSGSDKKGNCFQGQIKGLEAQGNIAYNREKDHLVALLGVEGLIVVHTKDATLICKKEESQAVKNLVKEISADDNLANFV
ncbi:sugar phosphate nucleotidyltransferase [Opitutae bacterium]|nr:sugar phosphate nucleotidyltransferase [Opitutae bacterium]